MGGFNFQIYINSIQVGGRESLFDVLGLYGLTVTFDAMTTTAEQQLSAVKHTAWKGNRDASPAPAFGDMTGTPAYYDSPKSLLRLADVSSVTTTTLCTRSCVIDATPSSKFLGKKWVPSGTQCRDNGINPADCSTPPPACGAPVPETIQNTINCQWSDRQTGPGRGGGHLLSRWHLQRHLHRGGLFVRREQLQLL